MPTQTLDLSEQQAQFIRQSVDEGRYSDASEVVRAALRLLEKQEQQDKVKLDILRRVAQQSFEQIDRGDFEMIDLDNLDEFMDRMDAQARASLR